MQINSIDEIECVEHEGTMENAIKRLFNTHLASRKKTQVRTIAKARCKHVRRIYTLV